MAFARSPDARRRHARRLRQTRVKDHRVKSVMTLLCAAITLFSVAPATRAQTYPDRPIQLVVGFPPGGGVDIVARQLAERRAPV